MNQKVLLSWFDNGVPYGYIVTEHYPGSVVRRLKLNEVRAVEATFAKIPVKWRSVLYEIGVRFNPTVSTPADAWKLLLNTPHGLYVLVQGENGSEAMRKLSEADMMMPNVVLARLYLPKTIVKIGVFGRVWREADGTVMGEYHNGQGLAYSTVLTQQNIITYDAEIRAYDAEVAKEKAVVQQMQIKNNEDRNQIKKAMETDYKKLRTPECIYFSRSGWMGQHMVGRINEGKPFLLSEEEVNYTPNAMMIGDIKAMYAAPGVFDNHFELVDKLWCHRASRVGLSKEELDAMLARTLHLTRGVRDIKKDLTFFEGIKGPEGKVKIRVNELVREVLQAIGRTVMHDLQVEDASESKWKADYPTKVSVMTDYLTLLMIVNKSGEEIMIDYPDWVRIINNPEPEDSNGLS